MRTRRTIEGFEFERFRNVKGSYVSKVSIRKQGHIGLSQGLLKRLGIKDGDWFVELYYDRNRNAIALGFTQEKIEDVAKLQLRPSNPNDTDNLTAHVAAKAFLDYCGINYSKKTISYDPEVYAEKMIVIVRLDADSNEDNEREDAMHDEV